jgi:hypothetical protein
MAITRRVFVSAAMAAPLVSQVGGVGTAGAEQFSDGPRYTALDGLAELRMSDFTLRQLATQDIRLEALEPATPIMGNGRTEGVKLVPEYATGTITPLGQPGEGSGRMLGGVALADSDTRMEITDLQGLMPDGIVSALLKVDDEWLGRLPLYTSDLGAVRLSLTPGPPGQPIAVQGSGIPGTLTQEGVDVFTKAFGTALFTTRDTVFTASVQGKAWPLP